MGVRNARLELLPGGHPQGKPAEPGPGPGTGEALSDQRRPEAAGGEERGVIAGRSVEEEGVRVEEDHAGREGESLLLEASLEGDDRAAHRVVDDGDRDSAEDVVHHLVKHEHAQRISAGLPADRDDGDAIPAHEEDGVSAPHLQGLGLRRGHRREALQRSEHSGGLGALQLLGRHPQTLRREAVQGVGGGEAVEPAHALHRSQDEDEGADEKEEPREGADRSGRGRALRVHAGGPPRTGTRTEGIASRESRQRKSRMTGRCSRLAKKSRRARGRLGSRSNRIAMARK